MNMMVGAAAIVGFSKSIPTEAAALVEDPIFGAIEAHKAAYALLGEAISRHSKLENELPKDQRETHITIWDQTVVGTDDPLWIKAEHDVWAAYEAGDDAAGALVNVRPTTTQGRHALLTYALLHDTDGMAWPQDMDSNNERRSWHYCLIENVLAALTMGLRDRHEAALS